MVTATGEAQCAARAAVRSASPRWRVVVRRAECHAVVNPAHPDAAPLAVSAPQLVVWDQVVHRGRDAPP